MPSEKKKRLAIVIEGKQNSGKSSVWKVLIDKANETMGKKKQKQARSCWRFLSIYEDIPSIKLWVKILSGSCEELEIDIEDRLEKDKQQYGQYPDILLLSVQRDGELSKRERGTIDFLSFNKYEIKHFPKEGKGAKYWKYTNNKPNKYELSAISKKRAGDIIDLLKKELKPHLK